MVGSLSGGSITLGGRLFTPGFLILCVMVLSLSVGVVIFFFGASPREAGCGVWLAVGEVVFFPSLGDMFCSINIRAWSRDYPKPYIRRCDVGIIGASVTGDFLIFTAHYRRWSR